MEKISFTEIRSLFKNTELILFFILVCGNVYSIKDTTIQLNYGTAKIPVSIRYPKEKNTGSLLLLHGWNLPSGQWCEKTSICSKALQLGYTLIIPDFGKTTYHWEMYPETIEKYKRYPTRKWMTDSLFSWLQSKMDLLIPGRNNFVAGISTGGRGAALFALEHPEIFKGAACLSADFDQSKIAGEPINTGYYGSFEKFPERWKGRDNIFLRANEFRVPLLLIHGKLDKMCPPSQSEEFFRELKRLHPDLHAELIIAPKGQHNYQLWSAYSDRILRFFSSMTK